MKTILFLLLTILLIFSCASYKSIQEIDGAAGTDFNNSKVQALCVSEHGSDLALFQPANYLELLDISGKTARDIVTSKEIIINPRFSKTGKFAAYTQVKEKIVGTESSEIIIYDLENFSIKKQIPVIPPPKPSESIRKVIGNAFSSTQITTMRVRCFEPQWADNDSSIYFISGFGLYHYRFFSDTLRGFIPGRFFYITVNDSARRIAAITDTSIQILSMDSLQVTKQLQGEALFCFWDLSGANLTCVMNDKNKNLIINLPVNSGKLDTIGYIRESVISGGFWENDSSFYICSGTDVQKNRINMQGAVNVQKFKLKQPLPEYVFKDAGNIYDTGLIPAKRGFFICGNELSYIHANKIYKLYPRRISDLHIEKK